MSVSSSSPFVTNRRNASRCQRGRSNDHLRISLRTLTLATHTSELQSGQSVLGVGQSVRVALPDVSQFHIDSLEAAHGLSEFHTRVAPRIVRIYTLRGFESVLAGSVQVSTGTKTSLSFQDGPVFTRVHRREGPAAPRSLLPSDPRARPRVFKTEFILDYLSQPALRTRIRRGLLKGEQLHALAQLSSIGRFGRSIVF